MKKLLIVTSLLLSSLAYSFSEAELERVMDPKEKQLNAIRKEEIRSLETIVQRRVSANKQPDILMRLIELYAVSQSFYKVKENEYAQEYKKPYNYLVNLLPIKLQSFHGCIILKSNFLELKVI